MVSYETTNTVYTANHKYRYIVNGKQFMTIPVLSDYTSVKAYNARMTALCLNMYS
jgi:hypothetical protein